jgi:hypothetical protein
MPLHRFASEQDVPFGAETVVHPISGLQPSTVQSSPSSQPAGRLEAHVPVWQVSSPLHRLASEHVVPSGRAACTHPNDGAQLSLVQTFKSLQFGGGPPTQAPFWHASAFEHALESLHALPFARGTASQLSVASLHTPRVHCDVPLEQSRGVPPTQLPALHRPPVVQNCPASHALPFASADPAVQLPA